MMLWILAPALAESSGINWPQLVTSLGTAGASVAFVLWFARHVVTETIPKMLETHKATIDKITTEMAAQRAECTSVAEKQRIHDSEKFQQLRSTMESTAQVQADAIRESTRETTAAIKEVCASLKEHNDTHHRPDPPKKPTRNHDA